MSNRNRIAFQLTVAEVAALGSVAADGAASAMVDWRTWRSLAGKGLVLCDAGGAVGLTHAGELARALASAIKRLQGAGAGEGRAH